MSAPWDHGEVLAALLPVAVAVVESDPALLTGAVDELDPAEREVVAEARSVRRRDFAAGRACARRALVALGHPPVAVGAGVAREPLWPEGVVGSITHCEGYVAAAVAHSEVVRAVGIDAERNVALDPALHRRILAPGEVPAGGGGVVDPVLLAFSAKEAAFKAWYPLTHTWLELHEAAVTVLGSTFVVRVVADHRVGGGEAPSCLSGRWAATDRHVFCAVGLGAPGAPHAAQPEPET